MKKTIMIGTIFLLIGLLIYSNKTELYRFGRNIIKHRNELKVEKEIMDSETIWGIDISHHQKNINWDELVKHNKPDFIFLKCSEGVTHQDTKYKIYKKEAEQHDILMGAYHFFSYETPGKKQAENFIKHANLKKGDMIPVLDLEYVAGRNSYKNKLNEIKAFCKTIKSEYGVNPIIYCECDYKQKVLDSYFDDFIFWISSMTREPNCNYTIWQYTDRGSVKGIGKIDNNILNSTKEISDLILVQ